MSYLNLSLDGGVQYISVDIVPERVVNLVRLNFKDNQRFQNGLVLRPGTTQFSAAVGATIRGLATTTNSQTGYVVDGNTFYEVNTSGTRTSRGTLVTSTGSVDIIIGVDNVFINENDTANGYVYVPSTNTFAQISDPDFPDLLKATYQDTYFVGIQRNSGRIWHSANDDASSWSATAFATAESLPDNAVSILSFDRTLFIFGEQSIEYWFTSGETFPFNRRSFTNLGCAATNSVTWLSGNVYFVGRNQHSIGQIYVVSNQQLPTKISTQTIETRLEAASDISDCRSWAMEHDGNQLIVFVFPTADITLVYNATTNSWAEWEDSGGNYYPNSFYMRLANKHIVGSAAAGTLYTTNFTLSDDNGTDFNWLLITPTLFAENRLMIPQRIKLDIDDNAANGASIALEDSTDGGNNFATGRTRTVVTGKYLDWNMPASGRLLTYRMSGVSTVIWRLFNLSTDIGIGGDL